MKVTIQYRCKPCGVSFPVHCGVPDDVDNAAVGHECPGMSRFSGPDGALMAYMCGECGHVTRRNISEMIPAMASRKHGCGEECKPE